MDKKDRTKRVLICGCNASWESEALEILRDMIREGTLMLSSLEKIPEHPKVRKIMRGVQVSQNNGDVHGTDNTASKPDHKT